jgi:hypothetical protein
MNNKISNLLTAIKEHIVSKLIQAEEVKSVTIMNQPTSPAKIKSPSKLFKHMSPKVKEVRDHVNPSGPIHFLNTITTILAPTPDQSQQPTGNEGYGVKGETPEKDHEVAKSLSDLFEDSITQESGELDESKEK